MIPFDVRLANFLDTVSFIADKERQRRVWVDRTPGLSSVITLGELYSQFFDDNEIDDFIDREMASSPLTTSQRRAIREFRDALDSFSGAPSKSAPFTDYAKLLNDPEWNRLIELATATKSQFAPPS